MSRPNKPRSVHAEDNAAKRIQYERDRRKWSPTQLAARMGEAGCPMPATAVYKIEALQRKISVDELFAFGSVFGLTLAQMVTDPADSVPAEVADLSHRMWVQFALHAELEQAAQQAADLAGVLNGQVAQIVNENPKWRDELLPEWNKHVGDPDWFEALRLQVQPFVHRAMGQALKSAQQRSSMRK